MTSRLIRRRFGLRQLLMLVAFVAVFLAGRKSHEDFPDLMVWFRTKLQVSGVRQTSVVDVADLTKGNVSIELLKDRITANVLPKSWGKGGTGLIVIEINSSKLILSHTPDGHNAVLEYLNKLRNDRE